MWSCLWLKELQGEATSIRKTRKISESLANQTCLGNNNIRQALLVLLYQPCKTFRTNVWPFHLLLLHLRYICRMSGVNGTLEVIPHHHLFGVNVWALPAKGASSFPETVVWWIYFDACGHCLVATGVYEGSASRQPLWNYPAGRFGKMWKLISPSVKSKWSNAAKQAKTMMLPPPYHTVPLRRCFDDVTFWHHTKCLSFLPEEFNFCFISLQIFQKCNKTITYF